jgi:Protein of unknown function (DUF4031)
MPMSYAASDQLCLPFSYHKRFDNFEKESSIVTNDYQAHSVSASILVDLPEWEWRSQLWCHLVSTESLNALHQFASALGLKREWFQNEPSFPHYDITIFKRRQALRLGASSVSTQVLVAHTYLETWPSDEFKIHRLRMREKYPLNQKLLTHHNANSRSWNRC